VDYALGVEEHQPLGHLPEDVPGLHLVEVPLLTDLVEELTPLHALHDQEHVLLCAEDVVEA